MAEAQFPVYETYFTRTPFQLLSGAGWNRLPALRMDEAGVTLGGAPGQYRKQTAFAPWPHITAVILWQWHMLDHAPRLVTDDQTRDYVGLRRHPGAPHLPGAWRNISPKRAAKYYPHVEWDVVRASRPVVLWRLDTGLLRAAVSAFAPHVPIYDIRHLRAWERRHRWPPYHLAEENKLGENRPGWPWH